MINTFNVNTASAMERFLLLLDLSVALDSADYKIFIYTLTINV